MTDSALQHNTRNFRWFESLFPLAATLILNRSPLGRIGSSQCPKLVVKSQHIEAIRTGCTAFVSTHDLLVGMTLKCLICVPKIQRFKRLSYRYALDVRKTLSPALHQAEGFLIYPAAFSLDTALIETESLLALAQRFRIHLQGLRAQLTQSAYLEAWLAETEKNESALAERRSCQMPARDTFCINTSAWLKIDYARLHLGEATCVSLKADPRTAEGNFLIFCRDAKGEIQGRMPISYDLFDQGKLAILIEQYPFIHFDCSD